MESAAPYGLVRQLSRRRLRSELAAGSRSGKKRRNRDNPTVDCYHRRSATELAARFAFDGWDAFRTAHRDRRRPFRCCPEETSGVLDRLWAPWRAQYIQTASSSSQSSISCFLCGGLAGEHDRENLVVLRRAHSFVVLNRYPYNNGHLLVAPKVHKGGIGELEGPELHEPIETIQKMIRALDRMLQPQGYNIGLNQGKSAGAGLPGHLHWHIVPRWDGDTNFMPILGDTKVIVESLVAFYDRLRLELDHEPA